jgi:hypothetical protein
VIPAADEPALRIATARADEIRAELLLRVAAADREGAPRLVGSLTGPVRRRDTTLPTRVPLEAGALPGGWSRATFTEPAYWTPELPNLYRLEARAEAEGRPPIPCDRMIGLRRLGVRGVSCRLDGRRWVPRGVSVGRGIDAQPFPALDERLATLGGLHAAAEMRDPGGRTLAAADAVGVAVVARLEDEGGRPLDGAAAADRIGLWAIHPSVMIVVVPRSLSVAGAAAVLAAARGVSDTMLLAVEVDGTRPPDAVDAGLVAGAAVLVLDLPGDELPHAGWRGWPVAKPLVARCHGAGQAGESPTTAEAWETSRRRCDLLQAALAAWGIEGAAAATRDWAGYLAASW